MKLQTLSFILPPPIHPIGAILASDWAVTEAELGTCLPCDYKEFISLYGTGYIDNFLAIFSPASKNKFINIVERSKSDLEGLRDLRISYPSQYHFERYPASGGLLGFGTTDNGEILYWRTSGPPDDWNVVVYEARGPEYFEYSGNMMSFLIELLSRTIRVPVLPADFPDVPCAYNPISD